tara:strand:+ start:927 stop:1136 length:210 start_codon:yes stop_codon:yes gene_type:complete
MKLIIRTVDGADIGGGRALVLCNEAGEMLPGQAAVHIEQSDDGTNFIAVTFQIDGRGVVLDGSPIEDAG